MRGAVPGTWDTETVPVLSEVTVYLVRETLSNGLLVFCLYNYSCSKSPEREQGAVRVYSEGGSSEIGWGEQKEAVTLNPKDG